MDEQKFNATISEIREWLVRIDTNQQHQTQLLESLTRQAENAFTKADNAEDKAESAMARANEAYERTEENKKAFERYKQDEKVSRRWLVGLVAGTLVTFLSTILTVLL